MVAMSALVSLCTATSKHAYPYCIAFTCGFIDNQPPPTNYLTVGVSIPTVTLTSSTNCPPHPFLHIFFSLYGLLTLLAHLSYLFLPPQRSFLELPWIG